MASRGCSQNRRDLIAAEYSINIDTGGGELRGGKVTALDVQAAGEGLFVVLAHGEERRRPQLAPHEGQRHLSARRRTAAPRRVRVPGPPHRHHAHVLRPHGARSRATSAADMRAVAGMPPDLAAAARLARKSPFHNALLRTTCVATMLQAGHAENALPQTAQATVNCRLLPDRGRRHRAADARPRPRRSADRRGDPSARRRRARRRRSRPSRCRRSKPPPGRSGEAHRPSPSFPSWKPARPTACTCATPAFLSTA